MTDALDKMLRESVADRYPRNVCRDSAGRAALWIWVAFVASMFAVIFVGSVYWLWSP